MVLANRTAINTYSQGALRAEATEASPHRIIQMLMSGFLERVAYAKGSMERQEFAKKSEYISKAVGIINGLRSGLDMERGGEIAENLNSLYEYINRRLIEANAANDIEILNEVYSLMSEVKQGWDAIPAEYT